METVLLLRRCERARIQRSDLETYLEAANISEQMNASALRSYQKKAAARDALRYLLFHA